MIQMLVGPIANVAGQFLKNRAEKVKAKQELAVAKIQAQTKKVQSDANWEEKAMDASQDSIKDELLIDSENKTDTVRDKILSFY